MPGQALLEALARRGWTIRTAASPGAPLPAAVAARYPGLPGSVRQLQATVDSCASPDQSVWLFTADDYARTDDGGFRWNECELMALEAAAGDPAWQAEITGFWNGHFPFMIAVHSDYDYLAVRVGDGAIVHGFAPEFESPTEIAASFDEFVEKFAVEADAPSAGWPFSVFLGAAG